MAVLQMKTRTGHDRALDEQALGALASRHRGPLLRPVDPGYEQARTVWNGMIDRKPGLIARCSGAADVMACVTFAREHGLRVAVRGGGHNVAGHAVCDDGLVIDLTGMRAVTVDPARRTARVQGGAELGDLDHETQPFGLAAPVGVVSATGVAGLTLHGGFGWLSRRHGLSVDNLLAVDLVTADGQLRRASAEEHPDLYWAVRGGGGNFGVVTALEFQLHPVGPEVWLLFAMYPAERAREALRLLRTEFPRSPEELGLIGVFWSAPHLPEVPESAWGSEVFIFLGCYSGPLDRGEEVLRPYRTLGAPLADLSGVTRFLDVQRALDADYPDGMLYYWKSLYLDRLDDDAISALVAHAAARPSPISTLDVWGLGGAISRVDPRATAFARRDAPFLLGIEANWQRPEDSAANVAWGRRLFQDMQRFSRGGAYLNFPGFAEEGESLVRGAYGPNYERLQRVKAAYDPDNLFCGNLNIPPAA
jgi:FAD/FMN-containing dehydrogenase